MVTWLVRQCEIGHAVHIGMFDKRSSVSHLPCKRISALTRKGPEFFECIATFCFLSMGPDKHTLTMAF